MWCNGSTEGRAFYPCSIQGTPYQASFIKRLVCVLHQVIRPCPGQKTTSFRGARSRWGDKMRRVILTGGRCFGPAPDFTEDYFMEEKNFKMTKPEYLLQFFKFDHLPENLQTISAPFKQVADIMIEKLPRNPERTSGLRKLLEAKDCFVRAGIFED